MKTKTLNSIFIPAQIPQSKKLIIVLHGRGDSYDGFLWLPDVLGLKEINYLMLNAPDSYYTGFSWYDLPPHQKPGILASSHHLDAIMEDVQAAGFSLEETVLLGFSQGCLMTLEWGCRTDHQFAGMVGLSGYSYDVKELVKEASPTGKNTKLFITHGTLDEALPYERSASQMKHLIENGFNLNFFTYEKTHTIDEKNEIPDIIKFLKEVLQLS